MKIEYDWVGIWHAETGGQPSGTLTLAMDTGELGRTVVLDMVVAKAERRTSSGSSRVPDESHVVGNTLAFPVKMKRPDGTIVLTSLNLRHTSANKQILSDLRRKCLGC